MTEQKKRVLTVITGGLFVLATVLGLVVRVTFFPASLPEQSTASSVISDEGATSKPSGTTDSEPPQSMANSREQSDYTEPQRELVLPAPEPGEEWRRAFYDIAVEALEGTGEDGWLFESVELFNHSMGPALAVSYRDRTNLVYSEALCYWKAWRWHEGQCLPIFEGEAYSFYLNKLNGNPIILVNSEHERGALMEAEYVNGAIQPLHDKWGSYCYLDQVTRDTMRLSMDNPLKDHPKLNSIASFGVEYAYSTDAQAYNAIKLGLADTLLDYYRPPVPDDAPRWVSEYVKLIHNRQHWKYDGWNLSFYLVEPLAAGWNPVMEIYAGGMQGWYYLWDDATGMYGYLEEGDTAHLFYRDSEGQPLVSTHPYGHTVWHVPTKNGPEFLFAEGFDFSAEIMRAFCDQEVLEVPDPDYYENYHHFSDKEAFDWLDARHIEAMARYGYSAPVEQIIPTSFSFEASSWEELEGALVEALCAYAEGHSGY